MLLWGVLSVLLFVLAYALHQVDPGNLLAVTVYKANLMSLGGWGGYWLDRALFPYDRPHEYLEGPGHSRSAHISADTGGAMYLSPPITDPTFGQATLRRAIVVAACLVCVGLGA
jgi:hypothetical protein